MKKVLFLLLLISQPIFAQDNAIKSAVEDFFNAFHAKDTVALRKTFAKEMVLHSIGEKNGESKVTIESVPEFLKSIATIPADMKFEERLLSWKIDQDGAMAHVWTPYEFYINGRMSHKGVNSFSLVRTDQGWKILYCVDTRRRP